VNGFRLENPMCRRPKSKWKKGTLKTKWESNGTGGKVKVTHFEDGSSITWWGGPVGPSYHDDLGEEI
jgi:hypothetical protein